MDEILAAVYRGALTATEKAISVLSSLDEKAHEIGEQLDKAFHEQLAYLEAVAADLRKRLGIESMHGMAFGADPVTASAAAAFVDSLGPSGS